MKKIFASVLLGALLSISAVNVPVQAAQVVYNVESHIYHKPSCASAKRCTKNCIKIEKKEAIQRGGRPCKKCGG